jgi:hypothetical protein
MALLDALKKIPQRIGKNLERNIGGLLGENLEDLSEEERRAIRRQAASAIFDAMARGTTPTAGLERVAAMTGARLQQRREAQQAGRATQDINQARAAIAARLGARGEDVGEQTQLEEVRPMSGMGLQGLMASAAGSAAIQADPQLAEMMKQRTGQQVVGGALYDRATGQFIQPPTGPKKVDREVDVGNAKIVFYSDGSQETFRKGLAPTATSATGRPELSKDERDRIYSARDKISASSESIAALQEARRLSDVAYDGPLAGVRATGASAFPGKFEPEGTQETIEFDLLLKQQILPQLKEIFGASPTEGERKILLELQGSSSLSKPVRNKMIDRAIEAAQRRMALRQQEVDDILQGTYFMPGRDVKVPAPVQSPPAGGGNYIYDPRSGKIIPARKP